MIDDVMSRIGGARPPRLYIREWMADLGVNNKKLAERMDRAESTVSKLLAAADPNPGKRTSQKITIQYLAEFAAALNIEVAQLFRDPSAPTRDELLRGYSNEQLTTAIQLIEQSRKIALSEPDEAIDSDRDEERRSGKRGAASK